MQHALRAAIAIAVAALAFACSPQPRSPVETIDRDHDEAPDPRLQDPRVIAAAKHVQAVPGQLQCPVEVLGLVDVHEPVKDAAEGLELLKRRAVLLDAEAVVGVEFEHGEGGSEKTHLSGTAVRCNDLLKGHAYDVLGRLEVAGDMEHEDAALRALQRKAAAMGANLVLDVHFEHGESDKTKVTGTAVHAYLPSEGRHFGAARAFGNLAVYPITVAERSQTDVGPLVGLDDALASGAAEVRERGSANVNAIDIENKGTTAIFVLAGTVLVGGNQDRQIGQDVILDPKTTTTVDAYCIEHGRWNASRGGSSTGGRFRTADVVAPSRVRAAGQYEKNQGAVWSKVGETNAVHGTATATGTFLATLDDPAIARERAELAGRIDAALGAVKPSGDLVGIAFAVDGEIRGVRWFANHKVFGIVEKKLVNGIAQEAITARAEATARDRPPPNKPPPAPADVEAFVKSVEATSVKEQRQTAGANKNEYRESDRAYGSRTVLRAGKANAAGSSAGTVIPISSDFTAK